MLQSRAELIQTRTELIKAIDGEDGGLFGAECEMDSKEKIIYSMKKKIIQN